MKTGADYRKYLIDNLEKFQYINNCKLIDVIGFLGVLMKLLDDQYKKRSTYINVGQLLKGFDVQTRILLIYHKDYIDFVGFGEHGISYFLEVFKGGLDRGLTFVYELAGCNGGGL